MKQKERNFQNILNKRIDVKLAQKLVDGRLTITKIQTLSIEDLEDLGFSNSDSKLIKKKTTRQPIEHSVLEQLIKDTELKCCICQNIDSKSPVIIHHIEEYNVNQNNSYDNLIVLCLDCHGNVHTTRHISQQDYPKEKLIDLKNKFVKAITDFRAGLRVAPGREEQIINNITKNLTPPREYEIDLESVIGRNKDLQNLQQNIAQSNGKIILLKSIGGIGKTTLLKAFVKTNRSNYDHIIWIFFQDNLVNSFNSNIILLKNLGISFPANITDIDKYKLLMNNISNLNGKTLILIDNLQEDNFVNLSKLPLSKNCQILATTRMNLTNSFVKLIKIKCLDFVAAKLLFSKFYSGNFEDEELDKLLNPIYYHTLTIELLAKTLETNFSINNLSQLINYLKETSISNENWQISIKSEYDNETINLKNHLLKAFDLVALSDYEKEILYYFSILPPLQFSGNELKNIFSINEQNNIFFIEAINMLEKKGWIIKANSSYQIHGILQEIIKIRIPPTLEKTLPLINGLIENLDFKKYLSISYKTKYITCAQYILKSIPDECSKIMVLNSLVAIGLERKGDFVNALNYANKSLEYALQKKDIPNICQIYSILAKIHHRLGKLDDAYELYRKAIDLIESSSTMDISALNVYSNFAILLEQLGEREHLEQAKEIYEQVIIILKLFIKENSDERQYLVELATNLSSLGKIYSLLNNHKKSIEFQQKAYNDLVNLLGSNNEIVAMCANNLGLAYGYNKDFSSSLKYHKIAVSIQEKILDESHLELIISKSNLAHAYKNIGNISKAKSLFKELLNLGEKYLSDKHPSLARLKVNYALVCDFTSEKEIEKKLYYEAIEIDLFNYGENYYGLGYTNMNLATLYIQEKNWKNAMKHLYIANEIFENNKINNEYSNNTKQYLKFVNSKITE